MNFKYLVKNTKIPYGLASAGAVAYGGFMYDILMTAPIGSMIGFSGLGVLGVGVIGSLFYLNSNKVKIEREIKEKEFNKLKDEIKSKYKHIDLKNIFDKIATIRGILEKEMSRQSLFYVRMLGLINHSLELFLENLEIISKYEEVLKVSSNEMYKEEIEKNLKQNEELVNNIDHFIKEFLSNQNNDDKMGGILQEYERSINIYDEIKKIKKNS